MKLNKKQVSMKFTEKLKKKILEIRQSALASQSCAGKWEGQPGVSEWYSQGMTKA